MALARSLTRGLVAPVAGLCRVVCMCWLVLPLAGISRRPCAVQTGAACAPILFRPETFHSASAAVDPAPAVVCVTLYKSIVHLLLIRVCVSLGSPTLQPVVGPVLEGSGSSEYDSFARAASPQEPVFFLIHLAKIALYFF